MAKALENLSKSEQGEEKIHDLQGLHFLQIYTAPMDFTPLCESCINTAQELAPRGEAEEVPVIQNDQV